MKLIHRLDHWLHHPAPAERLAALRIAIAGFVTIYLLVNVGEFARLGRLAEADTQTFTPVGLARALAGPLPSTTLWLLFAALVLSGAAFTAGIAARISGPLFALLVLSWTSYHSSFGQLLHFEHLFTLHLLILAASPSADAWALRLRRPAPHAIARKQSAPPNQSVNRAGPNTCPEDSQALGSGGSQVGVRYGWPIRLLALVTATTYVLAGVAKLRLTGAAWFDSNTLATHIGYSATRMETIGGPAPPLAGTVLSRPWLIGPMAAAALAVELGAPMALFGRRARNLWVGAALVFHAATAATMFVFFGYRGLGFAMLPLFALEAVPSRLRSLVAGSSQRRSRDKERSTRLEV